MSKNMIKQLREASYIKGKQKTHISRLSDNQLYELYLRLKNGENAKSIAKKIKKSNKAMRDSSIHSISKGVLKFKNRIKHLLTQESLEDDDTAIHKTENIDQLSDTERLQYLADRQLRRILAMMDEEERIKIRNVNIWKEIDSLTAFQKAIVKAISMQPENIEELQPTNSRFDEIIKISAKEATERTDNMTDAEKMESLAEAVDLVRTMLAINIGADIIGDNAKQELIKKYPSLERFVFKDSDIITVPPEVIDKFNAKEEPY